MDLINPDNMEKGKKIIPASFTQQHNHDTEYSGHSRAAIAELRQKARACSLQVEGARFSLLREDRQTDRREWFSQPFPKREARAQPQLSSRAGTGDAQPHRHTRQLPGCISIPPSTDRGGREGGGGASRDSHPLSRRLSLRRRGKLCIPRAAGTMRGGQPGRPQL